MSKNLDKQFYKFDKQFWLIMSILSLFKSIFEFFSYWLIEKKGKLNKHYFQSSFFFILNNNMQTCNIFKNLIA